MTEDREAASSADEVRGVRTGDAVDYLKGVRRRLGLETTGLSLRRLAAGGEIMAVQLTERGWRRYSLPSLENYRRKLEAELEKMEDPGRNDSQ